MRRRAAWTSGTIRSMMKSGTMLKQRDIVLIPIPFTDLTSRKRRPVLIVSNDQYNQKTQDIVVMAITSKLDAPDYAVIFEDKDMQEGALPRKSMIRVDKIYTLSQNIVVKRYGQVKEATVEVARKKLFQLVRAM